MNGLRLASWLYVVVATLFFPAMSLDLVGVYDLMGVWVVLGVASMPLMILQTVGLHRVLSERAPEQNLRVLLYGAVVLHLISVGFLMAAAFLLYWRAWEVGFLTLLIGSLPLMTISFGSGLIAIFLGLKLQKYPHPLFGLQKPLALSLMVFGGLELANWFVIFTLPVYLVLALAVVYLYALIIEGHARKEESNFAGGSLWFSYGMATLSMFVVPMVALAFAFNRLIFFLKGW